MNTTTPTTSARTLMTNPLPPATQGPWEMKQIMVRSMGNSGIYRGSNRAVAPGVYTSLWRNNRLHMADVEPEIIDALEPVQQAVTARAETALVCGMGLGLTIRGLLTVPSMRCIDIVEPDRDLIALVWPTIRDAAARLGVEVLCRPVDPYTVRWVGKRWDLLWCDIWECPSVANLGDMRRLRIKYGQGRSPARWHGFWGRSIIDAARRSSRPLNVRSYDYGDIAWN